MADEKVAIVIDNGSCTTRVGFGGEDAPHVTFPSIVGHPKHYDPGVGKSWLHCSIGDDALVKRNDLDLLHPIKNGIVTDWDEMHWVMKLFEKESEELWHELSNLKQAVTKLSDALNNSSKHERRKLGNLKKIETD